MRKEFLGRGWAFPFQVDPASGRVATSEYEQNIRECVTIILGTRPGERQMLPQFGCRIHEAMFSPNTQSTASQVARYIKQALARWEPRIEVTKAESWPDEGGRIRVMVTYRIKATRAEDRVDLTLSTGG